jgi:hypothetical protein
LAFSRSKLEVLEIKIKDQRPKQDCLALRRADECPRNLLKAAQL